MIIGGYNIIDFEGKHFNIDQEITVDSSIVDKLKDITKPCVVGNFDYTFDGIETFIATMVTSHVISDGSHLHFAGESIISVTGDTTIKFNWTN